MNKTPSDIPVDSPQAMARVLAAMVATDPGGVRACELDLLEDVNGFERLGLSRQGFLKIVRDCGRELGHGLGAAGFLTLDDLARIDALLARVVDPGRRLLVASLAASVMLADGRIQDAERALFEHLKLRWGLGRESITRAILEAGATH